MRNLFFLLVFACSNVYLFSQNTFTIKPENADCKKPVEIKDTIFGPTNAAPSGYGAVMEISGEKNSLYAFEQEHNTCWYFFKAPYDAQLEFDIIPVNSNDDYDFILYKYNGRTFCSDVAEKKILPVRTCISRNDKKIGSKTGLSKTAIHEFIHSGPGPSYSKSLRVKKGDIFYLVVDNVYPKGSGHTIVLHYTDIKKPAENSITENKTPGNNNQQKPKVVVPENATVNINIVDKVTQQLVKANVKIFFKNKTGEAPLFSFDSVSSCVASLPLSSSFSIKTEAEEYFDQIKDFKTSATGENVIIKIELDRIMAGQNIVFDNILFYGNSAAFLPESKPVIDVIASTMKRNGKLKIEIHGHVNCPSNWEDCNNMQEHNMQLSVNRAKAVYDYLEDKGIETNRMAYKGFGATKMLFPDARSEDRMKKNRRVEILITSND